MPPLTFNNEMMPLRKFGLPFSIYGEIPLKGVNITLAIIVSIISTLAKINIINIICNKRCVIITTFKLD